MAKGIVLCQGDRTTCGGKIMAGSAHGDSFGKPIANEGDPVSCGKNPGTSKIIGGISFCISGPDKKRVAGSLDSYSSCPCRAKIIPSNTYPVYENDDLSSLRRPHWGTATPLALSLIPQQKVEPMQHAQSVKKKTEVEAGFAVIPYGLAATVIHRKLISRC